jgi:sulfite reductase alpha subunit-like flavoprotein
MARDVDLALRKIARVHGGLDEDEVDAFIKHLAEQKRYVRDVY